MSADTDRIMVHCGACHTDHWVKLHEDRSGEWPVRFFYCPRTEDRVELVEIRE